jgi:hypothetical protein
LINIPRSLTLILATKERGEMYGIQHVFLVFTAIYECS